MKTYILIMYLRILLGSFFMGGVCVFIHWLLSLTGIVDKPTLEGFLLFSVSYFIIRIIIVWIRTFHLRNRYKKELANHLKCDDEHD